MNIDELDIKVLKENYEIDEIKNIDINIENKIIMNRIFLNKFVI